MTCCKI